jgi:hypothetical protein
MGGAHERTGMEAKVIEVGQVFGRLTVVAWRGGKSSLWQSRAGAPEHLVQKFFCARVSSA